MSDYDHWKTSENPISLGPKLIEIECEHCGARWEANCTYSHGEWFPDGDDEDCPNPKCPQPEEEDDEVP